MIVGRSYVLLLGASVESKNRGVNALGLGAISLLKQSYPGHDFRILQFSRIPSESTTEITIGGNSIRVLTCYFNKYDLVRCISELWIRKGAFFSPVSKMAQLILGAERVFDINEGDSFSDIYGQRRLLRHFIDSYAVLLAGKSLTFLPQTIGPFNTRLGLFLARFILKRIDKVYLRDSKGAELVSAMGIPYEKSIDMACYMKAKSNDIVLPPQVVAVNINGLLYFQAYGEMISKSQAYKALAKRLLERILEQGHDVLLVPHTYDYGAPSIVEDDLQAIKHLRQSVAYEGITILDKDLDAQELKYVISQAEFFIGSRMHACIAALSSSVPTVGLAYSYKFAGTFEMFGQRDCAIDIAGIKVEDIEQILRVIDEIFARRQSIRHELEAFNGHRERIQIV